MAQLEKPKKISPRLQDATNEKQAFINRNISVMNLRKALHILQLDSQATRSDVKQAYRRLAAQWHPDLHAYNQKVAPRAAKKMQEINNAYTFALDCIKSLPPEVTKKNTSSHAVRFDRRLYIFLLPALACLALIVLLFFFYRSHPTEPGSAFSSNQTPHPTTTDQSHLLFKADNFQNFHRQTLKKAQLDLATIGYPTGKFDGIFGPQSLAAIQSFHTDFSFLCPIETAEDMLGALAAHAQVAIAHPRWRSIVQSEDFHSWLMGTTIGVEKKQRQFSTAPQLTLLLDRYIFATTMPVAQPLPVTELLWQNGPSTAIKTITVIGLETTRQHSFIKLITVGGEQELLYAFIRQGEHLTIPWPEKRCLLKLATGKQWYGKRFLFGPETKYGTAIVTRTNNPQNITLHLSSLVTGKRVTTQGSGYIF